MGGLCYGSEHGAVLNVALHPLHQHADVDVVHEVQVLVKAEGDAAQQPQGEILAAL